MNIELVQLPEEGRSQSSQSLSVAPPADNQTISKSRQPFPCCWCVLVISASVLSCLFVNERLSRLAIEASYAELDANYKNASARAEALSLEVIKMHQLATTYAQATDQKLEELQKDRTEKERQIDEYGSRLHEAEESNEIETHKAKLFDPSVMGIVSVAMLLSFIVRAARQEREDAGDVDDVGFFGSLTTHGAETAPKDAPWASWFEELLPNDMQLLMENVGAGFVVGAKYATSMVAYGALLYTAPEMQTKMCWGIKSHLWSCVIAQCCYALFGGFPSGMAFPQDIPCLLLGQVCARLPGMVEEEKLVPTFMLLVSTQAIILSFTLYFSHISGMTKLVVQLPASLLSGFVFANGLGLLKSAGKTLTRVDWRYLCPAKNAIGVGGCKGWWCLADPWTFCLLSVGIVNFIIIVKVAPAIKARMLEGHPSCVRKLLASFVAPFAMVSCIPFFYLAIFLEYFNLETAQNHEWLPEPEKNDIGLEFWKFWFYFYDFEKWDVRVIIALLPEMFSIAIICLLEVAMGSCSVESSCPRDEPLDLGNELKTHALANLLCGLTGGSTTFLGMGMTINAARSDGASHRIAGLIAAATCLAIFCLSMPLATYTPRFMSGAIFLVVGFIMIEESAIENIGIMPFKEYLGIIVCGIIFLVRDMEAAMVWGFFYSLFVFLGQSVESKAIQHIDSLAEQPSSKTRTDEEELALKRMRRRIKRVKFNGMLFWGSSREIFDSIFPVLRERKTKYIILNVVLVIKIDASAAKVIARIIQLGHFQGIRFCFVTGDNIKVLKVLRRSGMILKSSSENWNPENWPMEESACPFFTSEDLAASMCEDAVLSDSQAKTPDSVINMDSGSSSATSAQNLVDR